MDPTDISPAIHLLFGGSGVTIGVLIFFAGRAYTRLSFMEKEIERLDNENSLKWSKLNAIERSLTGIETKVSHIEGLIKNGHGRH